jgi:threonine aldolase
MIDLRSDTITRPSREMLEAMMTAETGDDVFSEDPTVNKLQEMCAELSGKESSLFVTSGVMGNQLAIKSHTEPGDEVIVESESHVINYETAAPSVISSVQLLPVTGTNGILFAEDINKHIRSSEYYFPRTRLICLENTHNRAGGIILPIESIVSVSELAREKGIKTHLDGARIFNAQVETGIILKEYATHFDSVSFCFSKGLGCPVGSILCGERNFIEKARKWRKILGGGMRQAGILAAAGIYALRNNIQRLKQDHNKAMIFAGELKALDRININQDNVQTNIVIFSLKDMSKKEFLDEMKVRGVILSSGSYENVRAVFHMDVSEEETIVAIEKIRGALA